MKINKYKRYYCKHEHHIYDRTCFELTTSPPPKKTQNKQMNKKPQTEKGKQTKTNKKNKNKIISTKKKPRDQVLLDKTKFHLHLKIYFLKLEKENNYSE